MNLPPKPPEITIEWVMSRVSPQQIYHRECPEAKVGGQAICSPLRKDSHASMTLFISKTGEVKHRDHTYPDRQEFSGSCIDYIRSKYGLSLGEALRKIVQDYGLMDGNKEYKPVEQVAVVKDIRRQCLIQIETKRWSQRDTEYWGKYGITRDDCKREQIYPLDIVYINRVKQEIQSGELVYGYVYPNGYAVYRPYADRENKWKKNIPCTTVENIEQVSGASKVLITKSKKCRICIQKLFPELCVINTQNETSAGITSELVDQLSGKDVIIQYDNDEPGRQASIKITQKWGWRYLNVPHKYYPLKDFSDMVAAGYKQEVIEYFKEKKIV